MRIVINGEQRDVAAPCTLAGLVRLLGLDPRTVLVEHNGRATIRAAWDSIELGEGDRVELLTVVAGG